MQHHVAVIDIEQTVAHFDIAETDALQDDFQIAPAAFFNSAPDDKNTGFPPTTAAPHIIVKPVFSCWLTCS